MDKLFEDINPFAIAAEALRFGLVHLDRKVDQLREKAQGPSFPYGAKHMLRRTRRDRYETRLALAAMEELASVPVGTFTEEDDDQPYVSVFAPSHSVSFCDVDERNGEREVHLDLVFRRRVSFTPYGRSEPPPLTKVEAMEAGLSLLAASLVAIPVQVPAEEAPRG